MSDDGLRAALVAIKAKLQERSNEGEAHLFLNIPYWELEELLAEYPAESPHLTDDGAADTPPADLAGVGAPSAAECATPTAAPSSPHPTFGEIKAAIRTGLDDGLNGCACESHICSAADGVQALFGVTS